MSFSIQAIIRGFVAPEHRLTCPSSLWGRLLLQLAERGQGQRESGAFLLGTVDGDRRAVHRFVLYDDLDPHCLERGIVVFDGAGYGPLWSLCRESGLSVVADVHTHAGEPYQSGADRANPMIAQKGHLAIIVPYFAEKKITLRQLGLYRYCGQHTWEDWSFEKAAKYYYVGLWG